MKAINWNAVRAATPASVTCNHCLREHIVVNRVTGLRADHYTEPKTRPGQKRMRCEGSGQLHTSTPGGTT